MIWLLLACTSGFDCPEGEGELADGSCVPLATADDTEETDSPPDTSADTSTGDTDTSSGDCPWTDSSDIDAFAEEECETFLRPCNHQIRVAIGDGTEWSVIDAPIALHSSVPDAIWIDQGEMGGEDWFELRIVYIDTYTGNVPEGESHIVSVASLPLPARIMDDTDALSAALAGEGDCGWRYHVTNSDELGDNTIDPALESVRDSDGQLWYYLAVVDNLLSEEESNPDKEAPTDSWYIRLGKSADGYTFETMPDLLEMFVQKDGSRYGGVDPDLFPLEWSDSYPTDLDAGWAPGGGEIWGMHLSSGGQLSVYEGTLDGGFASTNKAIEAISVATTSAIDGSLWVYGHSSDDPEDFTVATDIYRVSRDGEGNYGDAELVLDHSEHALAELGALSPSTIPLPGEAGLQLLIFHTPIDPAENWPEENL